MSSFLKVILPIFICFFVINTTYAQELEYKQNPNLDNIAINNETLSPEEEANVKVKNGDVVKIAGRGNPDNLIGVEVGGKVYEKTIDGNGNWFSLFTVQNLENDSYSIEIKYSDKENESLTSLLITDNNGSTEDNSSDSFTKSPLFYILLILAIPLLLSAIWFLISYLKKNRKIKKRV